ncbi:MAG TPA: hypothetical protein VGI10_04765 [Polyangiaceae bacterium]|jgi:hypothetical protein
MGRNFNDTAFSSTLKTGHERFLARTIVHALTEGWRTPTDFLRHFTPLDLMRGLEAAPDLRAQLLVVAAGVHEKIARKKSIESAAEDLRIALDEGITDAAAVLALIPPDDRVRHLSAHALWKFLVEDEFWTPLNAEANRERAVGRVTFTLETAIEEDLLSLMDLADGLGFETIAQKLPQKEAQKLLIHALKIGRENKPLNEDQLLECVPLRALVSYVPLEQVYESVIVQRIAAPNGFTEPGAKPKKVVNAPAQASEQRKAAPTPAPAAKPVVQTEPEESAPDRTSIDDLDRLVDGSRPSAEEDARRKVTDKLSAISRLPPKHDSLSTPILLSIESMYAELLTASTDEARELCIRDSFPNEAQMSTALLALIELLDPNIDVDDPVIRDADIDSLIKVVLFEERHRFEQAHPSMRPPSSSAPLPPPNGNVRRNSVPPPLPRASGGPPPLPGSNRPRS